MNSDVCVPPTPPEGLDVQYSRKTPKQICLCVVEKLNMIFLVFFICYLSWSIPANYGLFTSGSSQSNISTEYDSKKFKSEDANSTEKKTRGHLLFNITGFSSYHSRNDNNITDDDVNYSKYRKRHRGKKKKNKKRKKMKKSRDNSMQNINTKNRKRRKNKKCKKCPRRKKYRQKMLKLEPTTIRHIIERVAEEALQKGAGSMDFGLEYNPFDTLKGTLGQWSAWGQCSVTCNSGQKSRSRDCGLSCRETETMACFMPHCRRENKKNKDVTGESTYFNRYLPPSASVEYINEEVDTCEEWIDCNNKTIKIYLSKSYLPSCPCYYPLHLDYNSKVWDRYKQKHFHWQDIVVADEGIDAYKPNAQYCIRSKLYRGTKTLAAQLCCYDNTMRLITRGKSAGTPNLISPEISQELHQKLDISPWIICKGDWTKYNEVIRPNNELKCRDNPNEEELEVQIFEAQNY